MLDAKKMSAAIRMKRKQVKEDGLENMIDTAPGPQMNPQDILNLKQKSHIEQIVGADDKSEAPSDPADEDINGTSQDVADLKKKMDQVERILSRLSVG